jgi:hypothetical protein
MNWFDEFIEDNLPPPGGGSGDTTPPTITVISPTPGVAPGQPGGFPADWATARTTPIIVQITDVTPGNRYQAVVCRLPGVVDELVVYRRGAFRGQFLGSSGETVIANGKQLSILPSTGWPSANALHGITFELDALDAAGNLAA